MATVELRRQFQIFVIEEDTSICELLDQALAQSGYSVHTFLSAEAAIDKSREVLPHVILTAARLPAMSGRELLERVKKISQEIEVIVTEDGKDPYITVQLFKAGAYAIVRKPFAQLAEVVATVDRACEKQVLQFKVERRDAELVRKQDLVERLDSQLRSRDEEPMLFSSLVERLSGAVDTSDLVRIYLEIAQSSLGGTPILFFRHATSYMSIVLAQSLGVKLEDFRGVGVDFKNDGARAYPTPANTTQHDK